MIPESEIEYLINKYEHPEFHIPELMRIYGKQQWNEAINKAAKNAQAKHKYDGLVGANIIVVDKDSILKLLKP